MFGFGGKKRSKKKVDPMKAFLQKQERKRVRRGGDPFGWGFNSASDRRAKAQYKKKRGR